MKLISSYIILFEYFVALSFKQVDAGVTDYINSLSNYFGFPPKEEIYEHEELSQSVPYEISTIDEKFISEAAKLSGVSLSELDFCQQRVILKLKVDCQNLNDEQLAKLAVHLLNCQSYIEGRQTYICTDEMSIRDCTSKMDSDTWTIYHLMSNRARAVCYMIRQSQFRGLAENTVNRLLSAAKQQINTLADIAKNQENLQNLAHKTFDSLIKGHDTLHQQQEDIQRAQFHSQLVIEDNIARLINEKDIISETHRTLLSLTESLQEKLLDSNNQLKIQKEESNINHLKILNDLQSIQLQTQQIFMKIEHSSKLLLEQSKVFKSQYDYTLNNLSEVNKTVYSLVSLVVNTRQDIENHLAWISAAIGETDLNIEKVYLILWHLCFLLLGMLASVFLGAKLSTKLIIICAPLLNLFTGLFMEYENLSFIHLLSSMVACIVGQTIISFILSYRNSTKVNSVISKSVEPHQQIELSAYYDRDCSQYAFQEIGNMPDDESYSSPRNVLQTKTSDDFEYQTSLLSRVNRYKSRSRSKTPNVMGGKNSCHAKTRVGTPCKLSCLPGRDFCCKHQFGNSISVP